MVSFSFSAIDFNVVSKTSDNSLGPCPTKIMLRKKICLSAASYFSFSNRAADRSKNYRQSRNNIKIIEKEKRNEGSELFFFQ